MARTKDVALFTGGMLLTQILGFATSIVVARWLGPSVYGTTAVIRNAYQMALVIAPLGLDLSLQRHLSETKPERGDPLVQANKLRLLAFGLSAALALASGLGGAQWLATHVYQIPHFAALLTLAIVALPFGADMNALAAIYRSEHRPAPFVLTSIYLQQVVRFSLLTAFLLYGLGVFGIILSQTLAAILSWLVLFSLRTRSVGLATIARPADLFLKTDNRDVGQLLRMSLWMAMALFAYNMLRLMDVLVLGAARPASEVGAYSALSVFAQLVQVYPFSLSQTLGPTIAQLHSQGDYLGLRKRMDSYIRQASLVAGAIFAGVAVFGGSLDLVFGHRFQFDPTVAFLLPLGYLVSGVFGPTGFALSMTGRHKQELTIVVMGGVVLLTLCYVWVPAFGQSGAAGAVVVAFFAINFARFMYVRRIFGFMPGHLRDFSGPLIGLALAFAAKYAAWGLIGRSFAGLVVAGTAFGLAYAAVSYVALLTPEERAYLLALGRRFSLRRG